MKTIIFILLFNTLSYASFLDDFIFYRAQNCYKNREYLKALNLFKSIEYKDEKVYYNIANTLFKLKRYKSSIAYYKMVDSVNLAYKVFYNIANAKAALKDYKSAIAFYKTALKYKDSKNARYNLNLAIKELSKLKKKEAKLKKSAASYEAKLDNFDRDDLSKIADAKDPKVMKKGYNFSKGVDFSSSKAKFISVSKSPKKVKKVKNIEDKLQEIDIANRLNSKKLNTLFIPLN